MSLAEEHMKQGMDDLEHYMAGCSELSQQVKQLQAENEQLKQGIINDKDAEVVLVPKELYDQIEAENKKLKEEARWIPVNERLPENVRDVWIVLKARATDSYVAGIGFCDKEDIQWEIYGDGLLTEVTHWKPIILPEQTLKGE